MRFLSPMTDFMFREFFLNNENIDIIREFVNTILKHNQASLITKISIDEKFMDFPEKPIGTGPLLVLNCSDDQGNQSIIKIQTVQDEYSLNKIIDIPLASDHDHEKDLIPVIFIALLEFNFFDEMVSNEVVSYHLMREPQRYPEIPLASSFYFIQLEKFNKSLEELETSLDKWIFFLKQIDSLRKIPEIFKNDPVFFKAISFLEEGNWSREELYAYDRGLDYLRDYNSTIETAADNGFEEGRQQVYLAKKLLVDGIEVTKIVEHVGLSIDIVEELKNRIENE